MVSPRKGHYRKRDEAGEDELSDKSQSGPPKRSKPPLSGLVHPEHVRDMVQQSRSERARGLQSEAPDQGETVHRVGGRVVSEAEWKEVRMREDPRYRRERQRELDREFNARQEDEAGWRRGLEQADERQRKAEEHARIASLPLSSSMPEPVSASQRWEDPLTRIKSEYVSPVPSSVKPVSMYQAPTNRFNIRAGYRWDGVVRGNDYEKRWFERENTRVNQNFSNDYSPL